MEAINVFDYERLAQQHVAPDAWDYYQSGSDDEVTLRANRTAFERIQLRPRVFVDVSEIDLRTTALGTPVNMPVFVSPSAFHGLAHPDGECGTARGAGNAGSLMVVSTSSTFSLEEIAAAASGPLWFQLYIHERESAERLAQRAHAVGYRALVVTADSPAWGHKERAIRGGFQANLQVKGNFPGQHPSDIDRSLTWDSLTWLRSVSPLPIVVKGLLTAEDAALAVQAGVDAIIVSNHGGRQLDGAIPTIAALPEVISAVDGRCEVYLDGGIRRGTDALKALALGARAVLVGRPALWGLAVNGADGVASVLGVMRAELERAMMLSGRSSLATLDQSLLRMP